MQLPSPSAKEPSPSQKAFLKKVKIGILAAVIIAIVIVAIFFYVSLQQKGELHVIDLHWSDHHPLFGSPYATVEGTIFNSGSRAAGDVELIIRLYDSQDRLIKTEVHACMHKDFYHRNFYIVMFLHSYYTSNT